MKSHLKAESSIRTERLSIDSSPRYTAVVPAWNALGYLKQTLPPLVEAARNHASTEVVLIDNGSTDGTANYIRHVWPTVRVERIPRSTIGHARNLGSCTSSGQILCFIDADCIVPPDYFDLVDRTLRDVGVEVTGNSYVLPSNPGAIEAVWDRLHERKRSGPTKLLPGGNLVVTRLAFEAVGGFDETLLTGEDADLCRRLDGAGYQPYADCSLRVQHLGNPKSLPAFFRRNVWHSLGMFGSNGKDVLTKPTIMMITHLALSILTVVTVPLMVSKLSMAILIVAAAQIATPAVSMGYRLATRGGGVSKRTFGIDAGLGLILYWIYYLARIYSLVIMLRGRGPTYSKNKQNGLFERAAHANPTGPPVEG